MPRRVRLLAWIPLVVAIVGLTSCLEDEHPVATAPVPRSADARAPSPLLFGADSVWNRRLADDAPVDPSSPRLMRRLLDEVAREEREMIGPWIQTTSYSTPIYVVPADQRPVRVTLDHLKPWGRTLRDALRAVPIPRRAEPAVGTDGHLTIWQPSTDRLWELWRARRAPDGWHAEWGGAIERVSRSPGYYTRRSWPGARSWWGATATSLPVAAGTMRIDELRRGRIDHALALSLPSVRADAYSWPAQRTDGLDRDPDAIPQGARLRIDPDVDVRGLYLPQMAEAMALAAQRYGMVVRDQTHHAIGFYAEDPAPTNADPYPQLMGYAYPNELLADFPWEHVQVLRMSITHGTGRPQ